MVGEAARGKAPGHRPGEITGINHLVLVTDDMEKTLRFYCGVLGMKVRATTTNDAAHVGALRGFKRDFRKLYFLDLPDGGMLVFVEIPGADGRELHSTFDVWPDVPPAGAVGQKLDHVAFNVRTVEDLKIVRTRLIEAGVRCTEVQELGSAPFVYSVYAHDPNGTPIEFSTFDWGDAARWQRLQGASWYNDPEPPPSFVPFDP
ncbi:MAG: VOC family protein [Gammaproteobacteria bacterium]